MDQILNQLGGLVLGSVPTMVFFLLLVGAYGLLVRRPLTRLLAERARLTTGAVEQARGAIAAAEAETAVYEDKLRGAKGEIFQTRDQKLKQWAVEREAALEQVREVAKERVVVARQEIEQSAMVARTQIEASTVDLSAMILRAVLPAGIRSTEASQ